MKRYIMTSKTFKVTADTTKLIQRELIVDGTWNSACTREMVAAAALANLDIDYFKPTTSHDAAIANADAVMSEHDCLERDGRFDITDDIAVTLGEGATLCASGVIATGKRYTSDGCLQRTVTFQIIEK